MSSVTWTIISIVGLIFIALCLSVACFCYKRRIKQVEAKRAEVVEFAQHVHGGPNAN